MLARLLKLCLPLVLIAGQAAAQATFDLRVDDEQPYVNEVFNVVLTVEGYKSIEPPVFPSSEQLAAGVPERNERSSISIVRGEAIRQSIVMYRYPVRARAPGEVVIPELEFKIDGQPVKTQAMRISVRNLEDRPTEATDANGDPLLMAEISCSETRLFVGQQARFTLRIWFKPAVISGYTIRRDDLVRLFNTRRTAIGPFAGEAEDLRDTRLDLPDGRRVSYHEYVNSADLLVTQPGPLTFDDVVIGMDYPTKIVRDRWRGPVVSDSLALTVRPKVVAPPVEALPAAGRPANFTGAVGDFQVNAALDPVDARVGDPLTLTITLTGRGDIATLPGPRLDLQESLTRDFRVPEETLAGTASQSRKVFRQTIRAKHSGIEAVPPIEFAYFDPYAAEYRVARSAPLPVHISAGQQVATSDLVEISGPPEDNAPRELTPLDGLRGNITAPAELLARVEPPRREAVLLAAAAPAGAFVLLWLTTRSLRHAPDHARRRRSGALRHAARRLAAAARLPDAGARTREVEAALAGYLADRLDQPPARFTGRAAVQYLEQRGLAPDTLASVRTLVEACEAGAYAGNLNGDTRLIEQASACLSRLEQERIE